MSTYVSDIFHLLSVIERHLNNISVSLKIAEIRSRSEHVSEEETALLSRYDFEAADPRILDDFGFHEDFDSSDSSKS